MVMLLLSPVIFVSAYFQQYLRSRVMWSVVVDIRNKVCDHLIPQPLIFFENRKSGDLISRLTNDIAITQSGINILLTKSCCSQ